MAKLSGASGAIIPTMLAKQGLSLGLGMVQAWLSCVDCFHGVVRQLVGLGHYCSRCAFRAADGALLFS